MQNYYEQQLNGLSKPNSLIKVKLIGDGQETNWMDLNPESIAALRDFLDVIESELN